MNLFLYYEERGNDSTFFLRSGLFNVKAPAIIVSDTKSVYFSSSVAVKVDKASMNNSLALLNCRIDNE